MKKIDKFGSLILPCLLVTSILGMDPQQQNKANQKLIKAVRAGDIKKTQLLVSQALRSTPETK